MRPLNRLKFVESVAPQMISSGAVSPITRAMAIVTPVTMPASAVGSTTLTIVRHFGHAERVRRLAQVVRDQLEHLLAGADHERDHQDRQGDRPTEPHPHSRAEEDGEQGVGEEAGHDRRDARSSRRRGR